MGLLWGSDEETRTAYRIFVGKPPFGKCPLRMKRKRWKDNIKIDFREILRKRCGWICLRIMPNGGF
jgi:hypothetical protein